MITVYTQPHCGFCDVLKYYLNKAELPFEECNNGDLMIQKGFVSTPKLEMEDGTVLGYTEALAWAKTQKGA